MERHRGEHEARTLDAQLEWLSPDFINHSWLQSDIMVLLPWKIH